MQEIYPYLTGQEVALLEEAVTWHVASSWVLAVAGALAVPAGVFLFRLSKKLNDRSYDNPFAVVSFMLGLLFVVGGPIASAFNGYHALQASVAPRLYVYENMQDYIPAEKRVHWLKEKEKAEEMARVTEKGPVQIGDDVIVRMNRAAYERLKSGEDQLTLVVKKEVADGPAVAINE